MQEQTLPHAFQSQMEAILGDQAPHFFNALNSPTPTSIRLNPRKPGSFPFPDLKGEAVPWSSAGWYLSQRPSFTLDPLFHAGAYYVQEASSMLVEAALRQLVPLDRSYTVLDLCAAPGGKTTGLASVLSDDSFLVANEVIKSRIAPLKENLLKWGVTNALVTHHDPETMTELEGFFDIVLVDAPCSGEGMFRKDPAAIQEWSEDHIQLCAARQKRILKAASFLVAPGGILLYSTCTYNTQENEQNAQWLTSTFEMEAVSMEFPEDWGIQARKIGYQCFPHAVQGEGFYLAAFRQMGTEQNNQDIKVKLPKVRQRQLDSLKIWLKNPEPFHFFQKTEGTILALPESDLPYYGKVFHALHKHTSGFELGIFKGQDFVPSHALALSFHLSDEIPRVELTRDQSLIYLKREALDLELPRLVDAFGGWFLATYEGRALGWLKNVGGRVNNYLPKEWRIRMDLPDAEN